jgi:hypothetical protein
MSQFLDSLRDEITRLEGELRSDPRWVRLERAKALFASYPAEKAEIAHPAPITPPPRINGSPAPHLFRSLGADTKREKIKQAIRQLMTEKGPQQRKDLLAHVVNLGLMGHEKRPLKSLGVYLSAWDEVYSSGAGAWHLREQGEGA